MPIYRPARTLWNLKGSGQSPLLTASGTSPTIDIGDTVSLWLAVAVTASPAGTNPTLDVQLDLQDPDTNWYLQVAKTTQLTAAGAAHVSLGQHLGTAGGIVLPKWCRIAWTVGGSAGPAFPASISLTGR